MTARRRVVVSGRVQGVFFRDSTARLARGLGVTGWVRNTWDGKVEAVFEGSEDAVATMVAFCREGPPRAVVTGVDVHDEEPVGEATFRVR